MGVLLSKPNTDKTFETGENDKMEFAACSMQGWRTSMEDAHAAELAIAENTAFFGVYDGHAGTDVAIFASKFLHKFAIDNPDMKKGDIEKALKAAFLKTDEELLSENGIKQCSEIRREVSRRRSGSDKDDEEEEDDDDDDQAGPTESGSTAVTCLIKGNVIFCANAGDSRAVLCRKGKAVNLSEDHKPMNDTERERIEKANGFVEDKRVNGTLAVARALGDFSFKAEKELTAEEQQVTCNPEIKKFDREDGDQFIILACDGIWDVLSSQQACDMVAQKLEQKMDLKAILSDMFDACLSPHPSANEGLGCDNMTAIIVKFKPSK